jgi:hypothetical protein
MATRTGCHRRRQRRRRAVARLTGVDGIHGHGRAHDLPAGARRAWRSRERSTGTYLPFSRYRSTATRRTAARRRDNRRHPRYRSGRFTVALESISSGGSDPAAGSR